MSTTDDDEARKTFIAEQLNNDRPVLIPYWSNGKGFPCATDTEAGAHWSVIFDRDATDYLYLNPWFPAKDMRAPIATFLASNSNVDDMIYEPVWMKGPRITSPGGDDDVGSKTLGTKYRATTFATVPTGLEKSHRPLYPGGRKQELKNLLFSLFPSDEQLKAMAPKVPERKHRMGGSPP